MNTLSKSFGQVLPLPALLEASERAMAEAGYKESTISGYLKQWHSLSAFALKDFQRDILSNELIEAWLSAKGYPVGSWPFPKPRRLTYMLAALRILVLVHESGDIPDGILSPTFSFAYQDGVYCYRAPRRITEQCSSSKRISGLPVSFQQAFRCYEQDYRARGCRTATLKNVRLYLPKFFAFLCDQGINDIEQITGSHISSYITSLHRYTPGSVANYVSHMRHVLRFLYQQGMITTDLSLAVPACPIRTYRKIPSVWTPEEIERLLAQVDRGSPRGKRDYAILLLATRLGIRVGDIIHLTLDDIRWEQKRIEIIQSKTSQPLVLPLTDGLGWAIIDYLKNARPASEHRQIFLSLFPPFGPFDDFYNLHYIITRYRRKAGIQRYKHQATGMHTLRHSLATHLLANDTELHTISDVLGHVATESTEVYTKVDLPQLRRCAIDPEEVTNDTK